MSPPVPPLIPVSAELKTLCDIMRHVSMVQLALTAVSQDLTRRALRHDLSKYTEEEFGGYVQLNTAVREHPYGSPGYQQVIRDNRATVDLHFSRNAHHPEHQPQTFLDVIEMVCDWWSAFKTYAKPHGKTWEEAFAQAYEAKVKYLTPAQGWLAHEVAAFLSRQQTHVLRNPDMESRERRT